MPVSDSTAAAFVNKVADDAARLAITLTSAMYNKQYLQLDNGFIYRVTNVSGTPTWVKTGAVTLEDEPVSSVPPGGATDEVLMKASSADDDVVWSPITTSKISDFVSAVTALIASGAITTEQLQDIVGPFITDSADLDWTYNDAGGEVAALLKTTGVTGGTYGDASHIPAITVDTKGRITGVTLIDITPGLTTEQVQDIVGAFETDSSEIDYTYDDASNTITSVLKTSGASAGTYGSTTAIPVITVDTKGRVTAISSVSVSSGLLNIIGGMANPMTSDYDIVRGSTTTLENEALASKGATFSSNIPLDDVSKLFDSNDATYAISTSIQGIGTVFVADLGSPKYISKFRVLQYGNDQKDTNNFSIQSSTDGTSWTTRHTVSSYVIDTGQITLSGAPILARYWRTYQNNNGPSSPYYGKSIEFWGSDSQSTPVRLALGGLLTLLGNVGGALSYNAITAYAIPRTVAGWYDETAPTASSAAGPVHTLDTNLTLASGCEMVDVQTNPSSATTFDVQYKRGAGAWTSIYSAVPSISTAGVTTAGTLSTTSLNAGDKLRRVWGSAINAIAGVTIQLKGVTR